MRRTANPAREEQDWTQSKTRRDRIVRAQFLDSETMRRKFDDRRPIVNGIWHGQEDVMERVQHMQIVDQSQWQVP